MTPAIQDVLHTIYMCLALSPITWVVLICSFANSNSRDPDATAFNFAYHLNPRQGLASQGPFRFWISSILVYFSVAGYICWRPYSLSFTPEGFDKFIEISKFPLALLSLTVPVGVFISRLHSTQQTAAQIEVTDAKNRLDSFHAQRKGIVEYISSLGTIELAHQVELKIQVNQAFHSAIFRKSTQLTGAEEADSRAVEEIIYKVEAILNHLALLLPNFEPLKGRSRTQVKWQPTGIYYELIAMIASLCDGLSVSEYVLGTGVKRTIVKAVFPDGRKERCVRLAFSYYEVIAILNYCVNICYYALKSESRGEGSSNLIYRMQSLKGELNALGEELTYLEDLVVGYKTHTIIRMMPAVDAMD